MNLIGSQRRSESIDPAKPAVHARLPPDRQRAPLPSSSTQLSDFPIGRVKGAMASLRNGFATLDTAARQHRIPGMRNGNGAGYLPYNCPGVPRGQHMSAVVGSRSASVRSFAIVNPVAPKSVPGQYLRQRYPRQRYPSGTPDSGTPDNLVRTFFTGIKDD
jgi:hypothetical protein